MIHDFLSVCLVNIALTCNIFSQQGVPCGPRYEILYQTSSSALAKKLRDASCLSLSVVSFNSTKRRVESFIVSYVRYCVQLNALFCCLWHNVEASCHKHFVDFSCNQHRRLLPAMCHNLRDAGRSPPATLLTTPGLLQRSQHALKPDIGSKSWFLPTPPAFHAPVRGFPSEHRHPVWYGKTRMKWLPDGEKISKKCLVILTWSTNVTDTQTDGHCMTV